MEKNVIVVDENGNEYGATYPKRARGLVKSGRARFIDDFRICLACPPNINEITEDIKMSENKNTTAMETVEVTENTATKYTLDYVLEQIENLQKQITENSLHRLQGAVSSIYGNESEADDDAVESRNSSVYSVCEVFKDREDTLCRLLAFYEKMYDDLKPKPVDPVNEATKRVVTAFISSRADYIAGVDGGVTTETFEGIMDEIQNARYLAENK
ncbi:MAG: hypothetical protein E7578_05880 [Ruminococcaceae bacterium]|nr:hypothetical protein [Oscillospiraceae bacterium]